MKTTKLMSEKVEAAISRNLEAMKRADSKGDKEVVQMCAKHHWRLRKIDSYLDERMYR